MKKIVFFIIVSVMAIMVLATPVISDSGNKPIQWFANLTSDANILHKDVFPGIDLIYSGNQRRIEANMIVNPGADPGDISLEFTGITNLEMNEQNQTIVRTSEGTVELFPPNFFQEYNGKIYNVEGSYVTDLSNKLGVEVSTYNRSYPLKIKFRVYLTGGSSPEGTDFVPFITATKTDDITVDNDNDGFADPGDVIEYTVTIQNSGDMNAEDTEYDDIVDGNTTLNAGTIRTTPIARNDGYSSIGNVGITVPAVSGVLANDNDPDGTTPVLTIFSFDATSFNGGTVSVVGDGSFTYDPVPGFTGPDNFDYTIQDSDGNQDPATVFINVTDVIWFIDNSAGAGDGRLNSPFNSLAAFESVNGSGGANDPEAFDCIFVHSGNYTAPLTLETSQILVGQGATASIESICGITLPSNSNSLPSTNGTRPVLTSASNGINLASGNTIRGLNIGNTTGTGIAGTGVGTATVSEVGINGTGAGINISTGTLAMSFDEVSSSNTAGIILSSVSGDFDVTTGTINSGSSTAVSISGTSLDLGVTLTSISSNGATNGISINNTTGSFTVTGIGTTNGSGGTIQNTASNGISLTNTSNVSLSNMNINSSNVNGINGSNVFGMNLNNIDVDGSTTRNVLIENNTGTSNVTVTNSTFNNAVNETGISFWGKSSANITFSVTNSTFYRNNSLQIRSLAEDNSTIDGTISGNTFEGNPGLPGNSGVDLDAGDSGTMIFDVANNTFNPFRSQVVNIFASGGGTASGSVNGNSILGSLFGAGIRVVAEAGGVNSPSITVQIDGNNISGVQGSGLAGIHIEARDGNSVTTGTATVAATVNNNIVSTLNADAAIQVYLSDLNVTRDNETCINITNNNTTAVGGAFGPTDFFYGNDPTGGSNTGIAYMQGWTGTIAGTWTANGNIDSGGFVGGSGNPLTGGSTCATP